MFKGQNIRESLKQSVVEGLELAETAANVMRNHADDPWVQKMGRLVLGDRDTFQTRFEFARGTAKYRSIIFVARKKLTKNFASRHF